MECHLVEGKGREWKMEKVIILYVLQSHKWDFLASNHFMYMPPFSSWIVSPVLSVGCVVITAHSSALQCNKAECSSSQTWRASESTTAALLWAAPDLWGEFITQTAQRWFQYLLGSLFCIRLIWKTVDSCPLYTNEGWPSDWAEATFIMWRSITFLWSSGTFFPPLCPCILNSIQGPLQTRGPRLTWCILYVNMVLMYFKMQTRL